MTELLNTFPPTDMIAVLWMALCWGGYLKVSRKVGPADKQLSRIMDEYRRTWMQRMIHRENRMADVNIVIAHHRSGALFASTTILILAGIVALLGNIDRLVAMLDEFQFTALASRELTELKAVSLLVIFAYAFFKFAWCLRQYNSTLVLIGAAPAPEDTDAEDAAEYPRRAAAIFSRATYNFNGGMRAYYFGLATLAWFVHPQFFMIAVALVVLVLYRRDFHSVTVNALKGR